MPDRGSHCALCPPVLFCGQQYTELLHLRHICPDKRKTVKGVESSKTLM